MVQQWSSSLRIVIWYDIENDDDDDDDDDNDGEDDDGEDDSDDDGDSLIDFIDPEQTH